jgi:hypothetical protein
MWIKPVAITRIGDYHDDGFALTARQLDAVGTWGVFSISAYVSSGGGPTYGGTVGKLYWHPTNGITPAQSTANLTYGNVYHVTVTWSSSNCKFYINGILDSTTNGNYSIPSTAAATNLTSIGCWRYGGEYYFPFSGNIYSAVFYDTQLTDNMVLANYNAKATNYGVTPTTSPPVMRQDNSGTVRVSTIFDEVIGAPVIDNSLIYWIDAAQTSSYSGTGTTWNNLITTGSTTIVNTTTFSSIGAITFDGIASFAYSTAPAVLALTNNFSVEVWYRSTNGNPNVLSTRFLDSIAPGGQGGVGFNLGKRNSDSTWKITKYNVADIFIGTVPSDTGWHCVCVTFSSTAGVTLYLDGTQQSTVLNTANLNGTISYLRIGQAEYASHAGDISSVKIYNKVLTSDEITQNFIALRRRYGL